MLHLGLDLSRKRLDVCVLNEAGTKLAVTQAPPDLDGLRHLAKEVAALGGPVSAAIESMNGARFVHDSLELMGWDVEIADAQKVKGLAPLACKTDKIDAWVLAELSRRDLVPAIWLPDPEIRAARERARFRLHLVRHRVMLKNRIHSSLLAFGKPCPVSDLFGRSGRELLGRLELPDPWTKNIATALSMIDDLDSEIDACEKELRSLGADHPYVSLLQSAPGIAWVLGFTIASEIGETSHASRLRRSSWATPGSTRASTSPAARTSAVRSQRTDRSTCAGLSSRPLCTRRVIRSTRTTTTGPRLASGANAAPRSRVSR